MVSDATPDDIIEITADLDPSAVEALRLEIGRLAARHGVDLAPIRVEKLRVKKRPTG